MAGAEQVIEAKLNKLSRREEASDRVLVAAECVGPLVADSWEVVELQLDAGNRGPSCKYLNEATQWMCCCEHLHDGCACSDVV